jgi:hypothetical protein
MTYNSFEIDAILFNRQLNLYQRIDDMIKTYFDELDSDKLAVLSRTLLDLDDRMQLYKKGLQHREMFNIGYRREEPKLDELSLMGILSKINE